MPQGADDSLASFTNEQVIADFRSHDGVVGGMFAGARLVLITTRGARTGQPRTTPVAALHRPDGIVIFATNGGSPRDPAWLANLRANPIVDVEAPGEGVEHGIERFRAHAVVADPDTAAALLDEQVQVDPAFAAYRGATRSIAAVTLRRVDVPDDATARRAAGEYLLRVHEEMRRDMNTLRRDIHTARTTGDHVAHDLATQISRRCLTACSALHDHHTGEDSAFDAFETQLPELVPVLTRLRAEHREVAAALGSLEVQVKAGIHNTDSLDRLAHEYDRLLDSIDDHFAYEERELVPALLGETNTP